MTAAWLWGRSRLRHRWRTLLVVALIAGVGSGVALTAATGSRRAATGWQRFRSATLAPNLFVNLPSDADPSLLRRVAAMPEVSGLGAFVYAPVAPAGTKPAVDSGAFVGLNPGFTTSVYRPRILSGRRPDPRRADEVTINRPLADLTGIHAGDRIRLVAGFSPPYKSIGPVTVVGIHVGQFDVGANGGQPSMLLGDAFRRAHADALDLGPQPAVLVRLAAGDKGVAAFQRHARTLFGGAVAISPAQDEAVLVDAINVQKIGLGLLAAAAGLATLLAAVQAVGRLLGSERPDIVVLRSLGMRRRDLMVAAAALGAGTAAVAATVATTIAVVASPLVPTGTAGRLEPPGVRVEPAVLVAGAAILVAVLAAAAALLALRTATRAPDASRSQPAPGAGPLPVRLGLHWTFSRANPGPATVSARAALMAVVVGTAGITAVVTFAASLNHLVDTPKLHGWTFDVSFGSDELDGAGLQRATRGLADDPRVEALAWATVVDIPAGSGALETYALDQVRGQIHPTLLEGRAPVGSDEIAAGSEALAAAHLHVGSRVRLGPPPGIPFLIVGRAVYPELGNNADLANAGSITVGGMRRLGAEPLATLALVRVRKGVDVDAVIADHKGPKMETVEPFPPPRIRNIRSVGGLPWLMAGFLAAVALIAVGHALALSVRGRRQDLAVLRSLGAVRRQVAAAVWSQASVTVLAGALVGVPIGVAVGRTAWGLVASGLGVLDRPVVAAGVLGAAVAGVLVVANLVAVGPAVVASRLRPAAILRSE